MNPLRRARNDRNWCAENKVLASAEIDGPYVHVHDIRDFVYGPKKTDTVERYAERTFKIADLDTIDFFVEPFSTGRQRNSKGKAHTFMSFGFQGEYVTVSVEVRREVGQRFSPMRSIHTPFEITYVVGTETDVVKLRTNHRGRGQNEVYVYPIETTHLVAQEMFCSMMHKVNALKKEPEQYRLFTNNCTSSLARHVNIINPGRIPKSLALVLPAYSGQLAHKLGLIRAPPGMPFQQVQELCKVNEYARTYKEGLDFSSHIRQGHAALGLR